MKPKRILPWRWQAGLWLALAWLLTGCGPGGEPHEHHEGGHVHVAPHGGSLVMLGNHVYQLEFVGDVERGVLDLYILDGEAENFIRIDASSIQATGLVGGSNRPITFLPVAESATGETVGDTARFSALAPWLADHPRFEIILGSFEIRGNRFGERRFFYPDGSH